MPSSASKWRSKMWSVSRCVHSPPSPSNAQREFCFIFCVVLTPRAQFDVQKAEQEKLAAIIRSEGESEAAKILTSALTVGPALLELRRLEAAKEIATTLARSPNVVFVPNHGNMILNVPKP